MKNTNKKKAIVPILVLALALTCCAIPSVFAQSADCGVVPSPVFSRDQTVTINSAYYGSVPWNPLGTSQFEARLYRQVQCSEFDDNGDFDSGGGSDWLWISTSTWWPSTPHEGWSAQFQNSLTLQNLAWGWNPMCDKWDMAEWTASYKVQWWHNTLAWPLEQWEMICESGVATTGHNEIKGKINNVVWAGCLSGYGNVNNAGAVTGLWPDSNEASIYGYMSGDSAAIMGSTNDFLGYPYTHDLQLNCHTMSGYEPYVHIFVSNDYYSWNEIYSGMITNTNAQYIDFGSPGTQFHYIGISIQVPNGQYGAVLYVDCATVYPIWS